jgi:hypothetical protein
MPELLVPWEMNLMGRFVTADKSLSLDDFSATSGWLEVPSPGVCLSELLARY